SGAGFNRMSLAAGEREDMDRRWKPRAAVATLPVPWAIFCSPYLQGKEPLPVRRSNTPCVQQEDVGHVQLADGEGSQSDGDRGGRVRGWLDPMIPLFATWYQCWSAVEFIAIWYVPALASLSLTGLKWQ